MLELIKAKYDQDIKNQLEKRFIAFDVETTGLNPKEERIIELGAVLFENGQAVQKFNTLVNAEVEVSVECHHRTVKLLSIIIIEN